MATLCCQAGDPDYLKVVLLREILEIRDDPYKTADGKIVFSFEFLSSRQEIMPRIFFFSVL